MDWVSVLIFLMGVLRMPKEERDYSFISVHIAPHLAYFYRVPVNFRIKGFFLLKGSCYFFLLLLSIEDCDNENEDQCNLRVYFDRFTH